jgi:ribose-phosphate pyrophosphokinase
VYAAKYLMGTCKADRVYLVATHGIFSGDSLFELSECNEICGVIVTNTYPISAEKKASCRKLEIIDVSTVFAEAIRRTHNGESISYLFDTVV